MNDNTDVLTGLPAVIDHRTRLVVLGSFPGVASLQAAQYYGHPRNHFWPILSALLCVDFTGLSYPLRLPILLDHGVGLWDVYASCIRPGSLDSAIREPVLNDLASLKLRAPGLLAVAHNGGESARSKKLTSSLGLAAHQLPSTSPANASWSFERKLAAWRLVFAQHGLLSSG